MDERRDGQLSVALRKLSGTHVDPEDLMDPDDITIRNNKGRGRNKMLMPDCANCTERCCVHTEPDSGILLSLHDVAHLVDSGLSHLIVGTFTFMRTKKGRVKDEIDQMPFLKKQASGNCHFYDESTGRCTGYEVRPTICRRFPYEVHEKKGKHFVRFIGWSHCPTVEGPQYEPHIHQMARDAIIDENVSWEDAVLLGDHIDELRAAGFGKFLPPPEECPGGSGRKLETAKA